MDVLFQSIEEVGEKLAEQSYVSDRRLATIVFLATRLNKPVLVEGPAGVGKTELARSLAGAAGQTLIRLQCYEGLDEAKALYECASETPSRRLPRPALSPQTSTARRFESASSRPDPRNSASHCSLVRSLIAAVHCKRAPDAA